MIAIINYEMGNLKSVSNAFGALGIAASVSDEVSSIKKARALVLPGVGAAGQAMTNLKKKGLDEAIVEEVQRGKPFLGICLGMQLLLSSSEEGNVKCLDLIKGKVRKLNTRLKVPQIGWNQVLITKPSPLLNDLETKNYFYFVHSYYCDPEDRTLACGTTEYEQEFCTVLEKNNIFAVQFHPERSGDVGLKILQNFGRIVHDHTASH